jgi:hypothetical protein
MKEGLDVGAPRRRHRCRWHGDGRDGLEPVALTKRTEVHIWRKHRMPEPAQSRPFIGQRRARVVAHRATCERHRRRAGEIQVRPVAQRYESIRDEDRFVHRCA